ncbi:hypothetical protein RKE29_15840 [Streptomyces sp. B1866]|uniref:hypothetical protein n=1 Tax=Streptomyces sp. B1866 TaxID=3075431 RepID=UPI0028903E98|nr:hypothetical protein [Streptomyces sp. B1866]MDT3398096.1 hypothetical protein [Streptomyces sp. B1866]
MTRMGLMDQFDETARRALERMQGIRHEDPDRDEPGEAARSADHRGARRGQRDRHPHAPPDEPGPGLEPSFEDTP